MKNFIKVSTVSLVALTLMLSQVGSAMARSYEDQNHQIYKTDKHHDKKERRHDKWENKKEYRHDKWENKKEYRHGEWEGKNKHRHGKWENKKEYRHGEWEGKNKHRHGKWEGKKERRHMKKPWRVSYPVNILNAPQPDGSPGY